jgi:tripartite-type tricarboxylate transporter receptor subunit TctC
MPGGIAFMKSGKLKLLAVAMPARVPQLPDVPTMTEAGVPNFVAYAWQGMVAPASTPPAIVKKLNTDLTAALNTPAVQKKLEELGVVPMPMPGAELQTYAKAESTRWATVIKSAGIKLD